MTETTVKTGLGRRIKRLLWVLGAGLVAGACFNLVFYTAAWSPEGILGGLVSAALIYILS